MASLWDDLEASPLKRDDELTGRSLWDSIEAGPVKPNSPGIISDIKRGTGQIIGGVGSTLRDVTGERIGRGIENYGNDIVERNPSQINSLSDVVSKPFTTIRESLGEITPQLGLGLASGIGGRTIGGYLGGALGSLGGPIGTAAGTVAGQWVGGALGAMAPTFAQEYGGIRQDQREQGIDDVGRAMAGAVPATALELLGPEALVNKISRKGLNAVRQEAAERGTSLSRYMGKEALKQGVIEGPLTEIPQTALERWGAHKELTGDEAINEYGVAGIKGFFGGAGAGAAMAPLTYRGINDSTNEVSILKPPAPTTTPAVDQPLGLNPAMLYQQPQAGVQSRINDVTGVAAPLTDEQRQAREADLAAAFAEAPANEQTKVASVFDAADTALMDAGVRPTGKARALHTEVTNAGFSLSDEAMQPVVTLLANNKYKQAKVALADAIIARNKEQQNGTPSAPSVGPAGSTPVGGTDVQGSVGVAGLAPAGPAGTSGSGDTSGVVGNLQEAGNVPASAAQQPAAVNPTLAQAWDESKPDNAPDFSALPANMQQAWSEAVATKAEGKPMNLYKAAELIHESLASDAAEVATGDETMDTLVKIFGERDAGMLYDKYVNNLTSEEIANKYGTGSKNVRKITGEGKLGDSLRQKKIKDAQQKYGWSDDYVKGLLQQFAEARVPGEVVNDIETATDEGGNEDVRESDEYDASAAPDERDLRNENGDLPQQGEDAGELAGDFDSQGFRTIGSIGGSTIDWRDTGKYASGKDKVASLTQQAVDLQDKIDQTLEAIEQAIDNGQTEISVGDKKVSIEQARADMDAMGAEIQALFAQATDALGKARSNSTTEENKGAVRKQSSRKVDVRQQTENGQGVGEQNAQSEGAAGTSEVQTPQQQAGQAWDQVANEYPNAPKWADLTDAQRNDFIDYGPENWTPDDVRHELVKLAKPSDAKFGKDTAGNQKYTASELLREIQGLMRADIPGRVLRVVDSVADLINDPDPVVRQIGTVLGVNGAYGVAADGRAFLIANRITKGTGRGKFLHEVGSHLGLERLLPKALYDKLVNQIKTWARSDNGSLESELALNAVERVMNANTPQEDRASELVAYFIEEAVQAGVDPTAQTMRGSSAMREWFRTLWAAFKVAIRKLGFKPESLTAQDVVDLAFGAARLEVNGTFHGTAAKFRNFRNKYIGSGEGATAYGWGSYLAQRAGIAKGYWKDDVARKSKGVLFDGVPMYKAYEAALKRMNAEDQTAEDVAKRDALKQVMKALRDEQLKPADAAYWAHIELERLSELEVEQGDPNGDYSAALKWLDANIQKFTNDRPDGALMRVDTATDSRYVYDYDKPVIKQPNFVADKLMELLDPVADEVVDRTNKDVEELTGRDLIGTGENDLGLLGNLIMEDAISLPAGQSKAFDEAVRRGKFHEAASHLLQGLGIQGIQFYDARSRGTATQAITFNGRTYNRDELREQVRKYRNSDTEKASIFNLLRDVLRNGVDSVRQELEKKVARDEQMYFNIALESAARYNVPVDKNQELARAKERVQRDYHGKQLAWLNANENNFSVTQNTKTRNLVVFNDKNIFRVGSAVGANRQQMKFGFAPTREEVEANINRLPQPLRKPTGNLVSRLNRWTRRGIDHLIFTNDLIKRASEAGLSSAKQFGRLFDERGAEARKMELESEAVLDLYADVPEKERGYGEGTANQFVYDSTREEKWGFQPSWRSAEVEIDPALEASWNKLSPQSQAYIEAVFKHGDEMLQQKKDAVTTHVASVYDGLIADAQKRGDKKEAAKLQKDKASDLRSYTRLLSLKEGMPYAPIKRFGDYVVVAKSDEYAKAEADGNRATLEKLQDDPTHYHVTFAETEEEAVELADELRGGFGDSNVDFFLKDEAREKLFGGVNLLDAFTKMRSVVDADVRGATNSKEAAAARQLQKMVTDMYLSAMAEKSSRQSELRRRGVSGRIDMLRSFAQQARADAQFIASTKYADQIFDSINQMRKQMRSSGNSLRRSEIFNELMARYIQTLEFNPSPATDAINRLTSIWYLATSPSYYFQNLTQPFMISLPVMAGRHDYGNTVSALMQAYADLKPMMAKASLNKQFDFGKLPADVQEVINELAKRNKIDIGFESELGRIRLEGEGKVKEGWNKVDKTLRSAGQKMEAINRLSTAIAAYRLELSKTGDVSRATEYAQRMLDETHGDYSRFNAPRAFNTQLGKVALQFRKFQLIQLALLTKLVRQAGLSTPEKRAAFKSLALLLGHVGVVAGATGLPGFAMISWVLSKALSDDKEPYDLEFQLRRMIGDEDIATLILRGAPTLAGADLSGKLGMGNALSVLPFTDIDFSRKGIAEAGFAALSGPAGGLALRAADGIDLMSRGEYYKGMEQFLPKGLADVMKAVRISNEGVTKRNGDMVMSPNEISFWESTLQGLGVQPSDQALRSFRLGVQADYEKFYQEKAADIKRDFARAYKDGDDAGKAEARQKWKDLQDGRAANGFKRQPLSELIQARMGQVKRERRTVEGIQYGNGDRKFVRELTSI